MGAAYFLRKSDNEVYQIGLVLNKQIPEQLSEQKDKSRQHTNYHVIFSETSNTGKMEISTAYENYRIKIVEVMQTDEGKFYNLGMFVKAIPFRDKVLSTVEKEINIQNEMTQIQTLVYQIKKMAIIDGIKAFEDVDLTIYNFEEFIVKQIDQILFKVNW